jgi:hypothetical protein
VDPPPSVSSAWSQGDALVGGGAAIALAATADVVWTLSDRFSPDFDELSAFERAAVALWDLRPLAVAVFAVGALLTLRGLAAPPARLALAREVVPAALATLAGALAALALAVVALAVWVAAAGEIGGPDELGFVYTSRERAVTVTTQAIAWIPLAILLGLVARSLLRTTSPAAAPPTVSPAAPPQLSVSTEMEELWRERLAYSPNREHARMLLGRIQALESAGDETEARRLADEMRLL